MEPILCVWNLCGFITMCYGCICIHIDFDGFRFNSMDFDGSIRVHIVVNYMICINFI